MDSFAQTFLALAILAFIVAATVFWLLSKHGPKGATFGLAVVLYLGSFAIPDEGNRAMHGAIGVLRLIGFMGGILGIIDLLRKRGAGERG